MIARLVARRDLVSFVRQTSGIWDLALLSLLGAAITQAYAGSIFLLSLLGLAVAWAWTGHRASAVFVDPDWKAQPVRSRLALVAGLATAVGFVMTAIVGWTWWTTLSGALPMGDSPASLVLMSALVGGALVFQVLRQSWRIPVATVALTLMVVVMLWQVGNCWSEPIPGSAGGLQIFGRLLFLLAAGAILDLWAYPIGYKTRWVPRMMRIGLVVPLVAAMLVLVELPPASLDSEMTVRKGAWLAGLFVGLLLLTAIYATGVVRRTRLTTLVRDRLTQPSWVGLITPDTIEMLAAIPPLLLLVSANNITWFGAMAAFVVARLSIALSRQVRLARGESPKSNHSSANPPIHSRTGSLRPLSEANESRLVTG
jgi:hypothetical protein